jgi:MYXO-CTERM domain-containing protein
MRTALFTTTLVGLVGTAAVAAASPGGPAPVIDGAPAYSDSAVVALALTGGTIYCSGTLVSPRIVVTAGHCVHGVAPPARVFFGTDPAADGLFIPVSSAIAHPDYGTKNSLADIGLVILARPVTIRPIGLPDRDLANPQLTGDIRLIGFGDTAPADPHQVTGVKFGREVPLARVESYFLRYGVGACVGDSGGPTLAREPDGTERLVGVISRGDANCVSYGYSTRVDLYRDWIASWIAAVDPASCDLDLRCAEACAAPDPDCVAEPAAAPAPANATGGCSTGAGAGVPLGLLGLGLVLLRRRS